MTATDTPLLERLRGLIERLTDALYWAFCYSCFKLTIWWPDRWMPWPLLPHAGMYAYSPTYSDYREAMNWHRAGRPALVDSDATLRALLSQSQEPGQ